MTDLFDGRNSSTSVSASTKFIEESFTAAVCSLLSLSVYSEPLCYVSSLSYKPNVHLHRVKKLCKLIFCQNFAKFTTIVKIFGTKIAEKTSFSAVYSFSTSPNLCQCTTVLNADVPNCNITQ